MGRALTLSVALKATGALVWLALIWMLGRILPVDDFGLVLYSFSLIALVGGIASGGWVQTTLRVGARYWDNGEISRFRHLIFVGLIFTLINAALLVGVGALVLPHFPNRFSIGAYGHFIAAAIFAFALVLLGSASLRAQCRLALPLIGLGIFRPVAVAAAVLAILVFWTFPNPRDILLIYAAVLVVLALVFLRPPGPQQNAQHGFEFRCFISDVRLSRRMWTGALGWTVFQHLDVIVIGIVLTPVDAAIYLVAARIAAIVGLVMDGLRTALAPRMSIAFAAGTDQFFAVAVATNKVFLISGALLIAAMVFVGPVLIGVLLTEQPVGVRVFFWLLVAQATVPVFGATGLIMSMTNQERARLKIIWALLPLALPLVWFAAQNGPAALAAAIAGVQMVQAALMAAAVHRRLDILPTFLDVRNWRRPRRTEFRET